MDGQGAALDDELKRLACELLEELDVELARRIRSGRERPGHLAAIEARRRRLLAFAARASLAGWPVGKCNRP